MSIETIQATCPDLEELAAFVEGRLDAESRGRVQDHLATCESCYEIYAETLHLQTDLGELEAEEEPVAVEFPAEEPPLAPVVVHPRARRWQWAAAAALAAALAAVLGLLLLRPPSVPDVAGLVASLELGGTRLGPGWSEHRWSRRRGDPNDLIGHAERTFRVGVRVLDLQIALGLEDLVEAGRITWELESLLDGFELAQLSVKPYNDLAARITGGASVAESMADARKAEEGLEDFPPFDDPVLFAFGKWVEAGRVAALHEDAAFFDRDVRRFMRVLAKREWREQTAGALGKIEEIFGGGVEASEMPALATAFEAIITAGGNG